MTLAETCEFGRPEATRRVTRGVLRLLRAQGLSVLVEMPLPGGRRADLVALSREGYLSIVEIKSSRADYVSDKKWLHYLSHCDQFFFAVPPELSAHDFPACAGLIVADAHDGFLVRAATMRRLSPGGRRAMLLRFARLAAERLHERPTWQGLA